MVKVQDTQIKNVGFNTSVETGTKVRSTVGESLAGIVTASIGVKKGLEHAQREQDRLDAKGSNLALNDAKLKYQELYNSYDWQDPSKPTSNEWMDFHEKAREETKNSYDLMTDEDRSKYDLFYATKDGTTEKLIHEEAKVGAIQLTESSLQNFQTEEDIDKWTESMGGLVTKKELYKIAGDKADSFVATGALDNMTTAQINETFPYMNFIKDPAIGAKFKELIVKKKTEEGVSALSGNGLGVEAIASKMNIDSKKALEIVTNDVTAMVGSEDPSVVQRGIEIANHNGIRIKSYDNLPNRIDGSVDTDPKSAVGFLKTYNDTKEVYPYSQKVEEKMEAYNIVASIHGLDITTEAGIQTAKAFIDKANDPNAPKFTMPTDQNILDEIDPTFSNTVGNVGQDKFDYIAPRVRELYKYTNGNIEAAVDIATEEWDSFDTNIVGETPYGMFAKSDDEIRMAKEQFSNTTNADDVEMKYLGGDKWMIVTIDDDGNEVYQAKSSRELKAGIRERQVFNDSLETLDMVINGGKLGESLRDKQITADAKEVQGVINTQIKAMEEKLGHKLNTIQKEQLTKEVVSVLKDEVRKKDIEEKRGFGLSYNDETQTVTFSLGSTIESFMKDIFGIEPPEHEKNEQKPMEEEDMSTVAIAPTDEIMNSILDAELGNDEFVEGKLHVGQENLNGGNGEANTTNYGVVITDFPKYIGESDLDHAKRYYTKKVVPALKKVKGIETASNEVIMGLSKLVWNKGNIVKNLDLTSPEKTISTLLDVTTTGGKHSNGVINRTISDYSLIANSLGLPEVAYVRTTEGSKYRIQYLDADGNIIYDDARKASTAKGSRISAGKTYPVQKNRMVI